MATHLRLGGVRRASSPTDGDAILEHLVDFLDAFMWQADPRTLEITFVTDGVREILGHPRAAWLGGPEHWGRIIHVKDRQRVLEALRGTARDGADRDVSFRVRDNDGVTRTLRHTVRLIEPPSGENELWVITTDVSGHARTADELQKTRDRYRALSVEAAEFKRQSLEDPLTRLPNRVLFHDRLGSSLRAAGRSGEPLAVLLMDLDRFKELNDTYGHQAGDAALREFALRLRICLRGQDTPARIGGDEFAAVMPNTDEAGAIHVAERICGALRDPLPIGGGRRALGASIGIAIFPAHGADAEELLARADAAMYRAKADGGGYAVAVSDESMRPALKRGRGWRGPRLIVLGVVAAIAVIAGAMAPVARRHDTPADSAARLVRAATALEHAPTTEVGDVVSDVERALAEIPWRDVGTREVGAALERLELMLEGLKTEVAGALGARVEELIASVHAAAEIARESDTLEKPRVPKVQATRRPVPGDISSPQPTVVATPNVVPSPPSIP